MKRKCDWVTAVRGSRDVNVSKNKLRS
jgi:hypothetical protein